LLHRLGRPFLHNFNAQERRLVLQVALIGLAVSLVVLALKEAVHWLFDAVMHLVDASPSPLLVFVPLLLGAAGKTLVDLRVRNRYDLNVIGMLESYSEAGQTRYEVRFNPSLGKPLEQGDILIVLGEDVRLDALLASLEQQPA
jgi:hypothetical protein